MARRKKKVVRKKLVSVGGGPYVLDAAGGLFRVDATQETTQGPDGVETVTNVATLTRLEVRYADDA